MTDSSASDLGHPLAAYADHFAPRHAAHASDYFDTLVSLSGVDELENARLVGELRELERAASSYRSARNARVAALVIGALLALGATVVALTVQHRALLLLVPAVLVSAVLATKVRADLARVNALLGDAECERDARRDMAWKQTEPLNRLHSWGVARLLLERTFPDMRLDPYVTASRVADLQTAYGFDPQLGDATSVTVAQSGSFRDNPFVAVRFLRHWMGSRAYNGSLHIQWTEQVRTSEGQWVTQSRSETLTASVTKPFPEYDEHVAFVYGHESVPGLSFSRTSTWLSGRNESRFADWRKDRKVKKVERLARRDLVTGRGQLTVMANREFEALFHAVDRTNEIDFRLLFTPLAQQEMVSLLNDRQFGYGDDFGFTKRGSLNILEPAHLLRAGLEDNPRLFWRYDVADARRRFLSFHADYFKALYFSLAPLLAIPLYRERRTIPMALAGVPSSSWWEHERVANTFGEAAFHHSASVTRNVLKTSAVQVNPSVHAVDVTAYGYQGFSRVDHVSVRGGDGNLHSVPVPWTEYLGVHRTRRMLVGAAADPQAAGPADHQLARNWDDAVRQYGADPAAAIGRDSLVGVLL
ncbi:hypothetical protein GCM10022399_42110 [Terrabacter ginsenosidimutans]|uniref:Uncharacterized protein n=1 Tax=Terrabacter ginsenosidimutans TaxID=490575 RepID=A0ABP7EMU7_9MICO